MTNKLIKVSKNLALSAMILLAAPALAGGPVNSTALQGIFDEITVDGDSSVNASTDAIQELNDAYWALTASGGSWQTIIAELAGYQDTNSFGIYDAANFNNKVEIFGGTDSEGATKAINMLSNGAVYINGSYVATFAGNKFGYYLDSVTGNPDSGGGLFYSDSNLNADGGYDHMFAYQGTGDTVQLANQWPGTWTSNEYILAWEDLQAQYSDGDYEDFVVMVESVRPQVAAVPEPATYMMLGIGLLATLSMSRRKRSPAN